MSFFPHSLLPHHYLCLPRTDCHREIKCQWEWEVSVCWDFPQACTCLYIPTGEVTDVWQRPYVLAQEPGFTLQWQEILARTWAMSVRWCQYWKRKQTHVIVETVECFVHPEVKGLLHKLTPLENGASFWNEVSLKSFLKQTNKKNRNKTFCLVLNFRFLFNEKFSVQYNLQLWLPGSHVIL